jgi:hypothetical protein
VVFAPWKRHVLALSTSAPNGLSPVGGGVPGLAVGVGAAAGDPEQVFHTA